MDEDLRDQLYLDELDRQALIADAAFVAAWRRGMTPSTPSDDLLTWSNLQAALFAGIVVARILRPSSVRSYEGSTQAEAKSRANDRAERLRRRLDLDLDSKLFLVGPVRDFLEHFDERLDQALVYNPGSVVDWYISDGHAMLTPVRADPPTPPLGIGLRTFFPAGGMLVVERTVLDLFAWNAEILGLRDQVKDAKAALRRPTGRSGFGGQTVELLLPEEKTLARCEEWLAVRNQAGVGLGLTITPPVANRADENGVR